ncbi:MAG: tyrosine-type recombinase/integrase [Bacteroidota bacterium]
MPDPLISVNLKGFFHKGKHCLGIYFDNYGKLNLVIRKAGAVWSGTYKCWYVPLSKGWFEAICNAFNEIAVINRLALNDYLRRYPDAALPLPAETKQPLTPQQIRIKQLAALPAFAPPGISLVNKTAWQDLRNYIIAEALSVNTIRNYLTDFGLYLRFLGNRGAAGLGRLEVIEYMVYCMEKGGLSNSTANCRLNAIKKYYEGVLKQRSIYWEIPRAQKKLQLPKVLDEVEIRRMFASVTNLKHKAILFMAYSAGLRVSDTVNIKISDIDSLRKQIRVADSKGGKDRYVQLGVLTLDILRYYLKHCKPRPLVYLFEGTNAGQAYSSRSAQAIFNRARITAGINKEVSFHCLRHSFATHLLEKGIDIKYIKDLLGHFSIKTTEIYLHVKKEHLINIPNPLDELYKNWSPDA